MRKAFIIISGIILIPLLVFFVIIQIINLYFFHNLNLTFDYNLIFFSK